MTTPKTEAEEALYAFLLKYYKGRGGRVEADRSFQRYQAGEAGERVTFLATGIGFGIEWEKGNGNN